MCTENLALQQPAWQSSTLWYGAGADRAVDGLYTDLEWEGGQCAASDWGQATTEWRVDLGRVKKIHHVFIQHVTGKVILSFKVTDCSLK